MEPITQHELTPEAAYQAHLLALGVTEEEIEACRASIPAEFEAMARSAARPTAAGFRALAMPRPSPGSPSIRFEGGAGYHTGVRELTDEERDALRSDIKRDGVIYTPILIDKYGNIIDGFNRATIGRELGIEIPFQVVDKSSAELELLAIRLNFHRRQLTPQDRRNLVATLAKKGYAPKEIAEQIGVTPRTVSRDVSALTNVKGDGLPTERVGKDGKTYPTQYTPRPPKPEENTLSTTEGLEAAETPTPQAAPPSERWQQFLALWGRLNRAEQQSLHRWVGTQLARH